MSFFINLVNLAMSDFPSKPRRKKLEVPIHKSGEDAKSNDSIKKTFGANFQSKKYRPKEEKSPRTQKILTETDAITQKVSRKYLSKENARLTRENEEIIIKFNELEELSVRKILKLKEKITSLQNINEEINQENCSLKGQSQELLASIEDLKRQLEISKHCKSCEEFQLSLQKCLNEKSSLKTAKTELEEDLNMLKTVVYRLNVQMERYQERLRKFNIKTPLNSTPKAQSLDNVPVVDCLEQHQDHSHTPISWGRVNAHTLGPLLDAYQDTMNEKDEIIESYEAEISNFTGKLKEIVRENELLHKSLTEDEDCSVKLKQEVEGLKREVKDLKDQNDVLIKKCALKQDKLEEVLKVYEFKVDQLKRDYSVVHEQFCKSRTEVAALNEKNKALVSFQDEFRNERQSYIPLSVHSSSVNECKKLYEELKFQYEQEKTKLKDSIESQARLVEELQNKISQISKEKEQLEKQIKKNEAKYLELEHTLNEVQFAKSACKKQLHKAMSFAKDLVAEQETLLNALNQRQHENKVVKKMSTDIASRMDTLKNQLKDVQKGAWQELTTVEKRIQEQNHSMEAMKQEHSEEIQRLQKIIKDLETNLLLKEHSSLPVPHYLLYRDKHT